MAQPILSNAHYLFPSLLSLFLNYMWTRMYIHHPEMRMSMKHKNPNHPQKFSIAAKSHFHHSHSQHTHLGSTPSSRRVGTPRRYLRLGPRPPYVHRGRLLGSHLHLGTRRSGCATCSIGDRGSRNLTFLGPKWKRHMYWKRSLPSWKN